MYYADLITLVEAYHRYDLHGKILNKSQTTKLARLLVDFATDNREVCAPLSVLTAINTAFADAGGNDLALQGILVKAVSRNELRGNVAWIDALNDYISFLGARFDNYDLLLQDLGALARLEEEPDVPDLGNCGEAYCKDVKELSEYEAVLAAWED